MSFVGLRLEEASNATKAQGVGDGDGREKNGNPPDTFRMPPVPLAHPHECGGGRSSNPSMSDLSNASNWLQHQASSFANGAKSNGHFGVAWDYSLPNHHHHHLSGEGYNPSAGVETAATSANERSRSTSTPNGAKPVIRPIPSRLGSPFNPLLTPGLTTGFDVKSPPYYSTPTFPSSIFTTTTTTRLGVPAIKSESSKVVDDDDDDGDSAFEEPSPGCSRTTPVNHKSVKKWRQQSSHTGYGSLRRLEAGSDRELATSSFQPISIRTANPRERGRFSPASGPLSAPSTIQWGNGSNSRSESRSSGCSSSFLGSFSPGQDSFFGSPGSQHSSGISSLSSSSLEHEAAAAAAIRSAAVCDSMTSSAGNSSPSIPVGVAVARQRSSDNEASRCKEKSALGDEYSRPVPNHNPATLFDSWPQFPPLFSSPAPHVDGLMMPSAFPGPFGFQFAKDPISGQVFFVPGGYSTHTQTQHVMWPNPAVAAATVHQLATSAVAGQPFNPMMMQQHWQRETLLRQFHLTAGLSLPSAGTLPPPPSTVAEEKHKAAPIKEEKLSVDEDKPDPHLATVKADCEPYVDIVGGETSVGEATSGDVAGRDIEGTPVVKTEVEDDARNDKRKRGLDQEARSSPSPPLSPFQLLCDAASLQESDREKVKLTPPNSSVARSRSLDCPPNRTERRRSSLSVSSDFGRNYHSPAAEKEAKAFLAKRSLQFNQSDGAATSKSVGKGSWEERVRLDMAEVQRRYKEKYKELYKLEAQKKRNKKSGGETPSSSNRLLASPKKLFGAGGGDPLPLPSLRPLPLHPDLLDAALRNQKPEEKINLSAISSKFRSTRPNPFENLGRCLSSTNDGTEPPLKQPKCLPESEAEGVVPWEISNDRVAADGDARIKLRKKSGEVKRRRKKSKKARRETSEAVCPSSCIIDERHLSNGMRALVKIDSHFHPSQILEVSPPDVYGILVDKERGNRPHIFSREEVLAEAIFEVSPKSVDDLPMGTRVCTYWSEKYNYLFPGTIGEPIEDPKFKLQDLVLVELDDGDERAIHYSNIRFLPPDYPVVESAQDPIAFLGRRNRHQSYEGCSLDQSRRSTKPSRGSIDDVALVERIAVVKRAKLDERSPSKVSESSSPSHKKLKLCIKTSSDWKKCKSATGVEKAGGRKRQKGQDPKRSSFDAGAGDSRTGMAAFLPAQNLWRWSSKGTRRARARTIHREIERGRGEKLAVGDCAIFLSTGRPDRPYVGRLESLWETAASGQMRVRVKWFYHSAETEGTASGGRRIEELKLSGALFESCHYDENDVQTISHRCEVLPFPLFKAKVDADPSRLAAIYENNDLYYLAGKHDPVEGTIEFEPDVLND